MTNVNYTQFSEEEKKVVTPPVEEPKIELVEETEEVFEGIKEVEETEEPKEVKGVVVNCARLNVRKEASKDAAVLKIINAGTKVKIDEEGSTDDFYKVQVAGFTGFCMKEFIEVE